MNRYQLIGPEAGEFVRELVPVWLVPVFVVVTELGNIALLMALFVVDYWFRDHRRGAHAIGLAIAGMALVTALKWYFGIPRPPSEVNVIPITGYSFPSGHATTAAIGYGILAYDLEVGETWTRYGVAGVVVAVVALSRVVLGVHYVRDVVAGVAIGVTFLAVAFALTRHDPLRAFVLAVVTAAVAVLVSGASQDSVVVAGMAVGCLVVWPLLTPVPEVDHLRTRALLGIAVLPFVLGVAYVTTLEATAALAAFLVNVGLAAIILAMPKLASRVEDHRSPVAG